MSQNSAGEPNGDLIMSDPHAFQRRTANYFEQAASAAEQFYDSRGHWVAETSAPEIRERFWLCFALYADGKAAFADTIVRGADLADRSRDGKLISGQPFDVFRPNIAVILLKLHGAKMADDVRRKLTSLVAEAIGPGGGDRAPDYQFHGYNDNMPAKAAMGLILGGEMLGDAGAVSHGLANLRDLRAMLIRRGINSEYNSPTYSPLTIHALAEIAAHARSEEARALALGCETRLWIDLAARFHPEIGCVSGPFSRAYTIDSLASVTCASSLLWFVLGEISRPSPLVLFENDPRLVVHHDGDYPFNIAQMCWFAAGTYHVPDAAQALFEGKAYPHSARATCELGNSGPDFPASPDAIVSYLDRDFTLSTAGRGWLSGEQSAPYFVTYKQSAEVHSHRDVGTVYSKLVTDDEVPGMVTEPGRLPSAESGLLRSQSGCVTVQSQATALLLSHPHFALGGSQDAPEREPKPLARISDLVVFPSHYGGSDELIVGGTPRTNWEGSAGLGEWIACRRGRLLMAVLPLAYSRDFGPATVTLERINQYEVIRSTLYQGPPRRFTRDELRHTCAGFVAEHASIDEFPSLADFVESLRPATVRDFVFTTRRARYIRPLTPTRPALDLEVSWSPGTPLPRFAAINGEVVENPRVAYDGVLDSDLPFLQEPVDSAANADLPFGRFPISFAPGS